MAQNVALREDSGGMMDKIDVMKLVREANCHEKYEVVYATRDELNRLVSLVMEECAKIADDMLASHATGCKEECDYVIAWQDVATAIRERKPT